MSKRKHPIEAYFQRAARAQAAGQGGDAEGMYREILAAVPTHADSLHMLGVLALQGMPQQCIESLDLVITSGTSIAHLADALGRPVRVALQHVPDGRWILPRSDTVAENAGAGTPAGAAPDSPADTLRDTPCYPTMRLFRQAWRGDWPAFSSASRPRSLPGSTLARRRPGPGRD